ncbi:response regulator receiver domain protein [Candidatus Moduliflexus flocculans]|uniref:Response regulator receiver domain protein n=1 Tax=Candidatus Moduliflexus flocculans TaxID=1499966 RepID=A0A0S6VSG4_9BACT|nr:response regulator receiver domain protein [Candidatus Moduliflexus flocculans]
MAKEKILLVEDEEDILELIAYNLAQAGYQATSVMSGEEALQQVKRDMYDLIILDLMLPGVDGLEVCKILKHDRLTAHIPIIMVTAKGEEADVVIGLELGADDYVTKPFSPRILLARIKAVLRQQQRVEQPETRVFTIQELYIDPTRYEVRVQGNPVKLTSTEFGVLLCLVRRPGWVFTRNQIIDTVKGDDYIVTDRTVDVQIVGLRKKLGAMGHLIETVRGVGYRFNNE